MIESILEEDNIPYFIHNDTFGSLEVGPSIDMYNLKTIMIDTKDKERARELLQDYLNKTTKDEKETIPEYSLFDKLRFVVETLIFSWFVPGRHRKKPGHDKIKNT